MKNRENLEILKLNITANMMRINQLLNEDDIDNQFKKDTWYGVNKANAELRQRLHLLRKDTVKLEKELKGNYQEGDK